MNSNKQTSYLVEIGIDEEFSYHIIKFFTLYSRLEAIWKDSSDFYSWQHSSPNFLGISRSLKECGFDLSINNVNSNILNLFRDKPPQRQIGPNDWRPYQAMPHLNDDEIAILFDKIKSVRNNLFHGGKWQSLGMNPRDKDLISGSIEILESALKFQSDWRAKISLIS